MLRSEANPACHLGNLVFREAGYTSDFRMPAHIHEEARLVLVLQGTVQHTCRKEAHLLVPSTLTYIPAGETHTDHFQEGVRAFIVELGTDWPARYQQSPLLPNRPSVHQSGAPVWLAERLRREYRQHDAFTPLMLEALSLELLTAIGRATTEKQDDMPPRWLRQAHDFVHAHFTEPLSIEAIATVAEVHPSHLMRAFRKHYRLSIGDYVRKLRIEYACHLLSTTDLFPAQIAYRVGFGQHSHFCRSFKSLIGLTPTEFRQISGSVISG